MPGGVAPKFGSEKVSRYTGVSQLQLRVSRYTVQLSFRLPPKNGKCRFILGNIRLGLWSHVACDHTSLVTTKGCLATKGLGNNTANMADYLTICFARCVYDYPALGCMRNNDMTSRSHTILKLHK